MKDGNQSRYASDEDILTLYNRRDEQAIAATQSKYGSYCRAVADRILRVREDAEECVNDTYLHAWNAIPPARPGSLRAFLGAIVRNLAINRLNYNRARRRNAAIVALDEFAECLPDGTEPITDTVALRAAFDSFLASLPERERVIFVRRYGTYARWLRLRGEWIFRRGRSRASCPARGSDSGYIWRRRVFLYEKEAMGAELFPDRRKVC